MKLSKRLDAILKLVEKYKHGEVLADIGSDNGYLPISLVDRNIMSKAYACDIAEGPLNSSKENIQNYHLENKVIPLLGSGMNPIIDKKVDMITISGMGGHLICGILNEHKDILKNYRFILQSNTKIDILRHFLNDIDFKIIDEDIVEDVNHIYEIIVCEYGKESLSNEDCLFGPILRKRKGDLFIKKWQPMLDTQKKILSSLDEEHPKYKEVLSLIKTIEGELNES